MAKIDDLTQVVSDVAAEQAAVDKAVQDLVAAVANSSAANDPAIQAAIDALNAVKTAQTTDAAADPTP